MVFPTLSILAPSGSRIRAKRKTIEVRSWAPDSLPLKNLVIIQTETPLTDEFPEDRAGRVVAMVDVLAVRDWTAEDLEKSGATEFQPGYLAWELSNIRPLAYETFVPAKQGLYSVELKPEKTLYPEGQELPFGPAPEDVPQNPTN